MSIIDDLAKEIVNGDFKSIEDALNKVLNNADENENRKEEGMLQIGGTSVESALQSTLGALGGAFKNAVPILPIPTYYGVVLLADFTNLEESEPHIKYDFKKANFVYHPVTISSMNCDTDEGDESREVIVVHESPDFNNKKLGIIMEDDNNTGNVASIGYFLPVEGCYNGLATMATNLGDSIDAASALMKLLKSNESYEMMTQLPKMGYKVTKAGCTCKGKEYKMDTIYTADKPIVPNKHGIHYAFTSEPLKNWYRNDYHENEVYLVQAGKENIEARKNVYATDMIIFRKRLTWNNLV